MSKAGLTVISLKKWITLPERPDGKGSEKAARFEAGLRNFVDRTIDRAFRSFKNEFDNGQAAKKRAVIQLIDTTMGGQKKFYQRWMSITEKSKLIRECQLLTSVFNSLHLSIKSVSDIAFSNNKDAQLKIDALNKIFLNMNLGIGSTLKRWREVNQFEKLIARIDRNKKEMCIKLLMNALNNGNQAKIR